MNNFNMNGANMNNMNNFFNYSYYFNNFNFNNYLIIYKLYLTSKDQVSNINNNYNFNYNTGSTSIVKKYSTEIEAYGNMTSCFQTEDGGHILCFYIHSLNEKKYKIIMYNLELVK